MRVAAYYRKLMGNRRCGTGNQGELHTRGRRRVPKPPTRIRALVGLGELADLYTSEDGIIPFIVTDLSGV